MSSRKIRKIYTRKYRKKYTRKRKVRTITIVAKPPRKEIPMRFRKGLSGKTRKRIAQIVVQEGHGRKAAQRIHREAMLRLELMKAYARWYGAKYRNFELIELWGKHIL